MRRAALVVVLLIASLLVNVAVAWGCAYWIDGGRPLVASAVRGPTALEHPRWQIVMGRQRGATVVRSDATDIPPPPVPLPTDATPDEIQAWLRGQTLPVGRPEIVRAPGWSRASAPPDEADYEQRAVWEDARGWPMRSLLSYSHDFGGRVENAWAIDLGGTQGPMGLPRVLPLRPILIGNTVNTIAYGAALWSIILGPAALRRFIRRRRHRCPACGYPIGESEVCSECGGRV